MRTSKTALWLTTLVSVAVACPIGCSDVGDSSAPTGATDSGVTLDSTASDDGTTSTDDSAGDDGASPAPSPGNDSAVVTPSNDTGAPDAPGPDEPDSGGPGPLDTGAPLDTGVPDVGVADAGGTDATVAQGDGGPADSGAFDAGVDAGAGGHDAGSTPDAGGADAGLDAGRPVDAGGHDAAVPPDAGTHDAGGNPPDAGGGPVPCTAPGQANCVKCPNSPKGDDVCSPTKVLFVERDIAAGNIANGQLKPYVDNTSTLENQGSCTTCLIQNSCLDDNLADTGNECSDAPDLPGAPAGSGVQQCLDTLACILKTDCQGAGGIAGTSAVAAQENINLCYCGGNNAGSACNTAGTATNGLCVTQEAAGFGFAFSDNKDILAKYGDGTFPSGIANRIFNQAVANSCTICQ